ncbi:hypothetical protein OAM67_00600 [bacterium]|nr:hypothetical protein [bacterium]
MASVPPVPAGSEIRFKHADGVLVAPMNAVLRSCGFLLTLLASTLWRRADAQESDSDSEVEDEEDGDVIVRPDKTLECTVDVFSVDFSTLQVFVALLNIHANDPDTVYKHTGGQLHTANSDEVLAPAVATIVHKLSVQQLCNLLHASTFFENQHIQDAAAVELACAFVAPEGNFPTAKPPDRSATEAQHTWLKHL